MLCVERVPANPPLLNSYRDRRDGGNDQREEQAQPRLELEEEDGSDNGFKDSSKAAVALEVAVQDVWLRVITEIERRVEER